MKISTTCKLMLIVIGILIAVFQINAEELSKEQVRAMLPKYLGSNNAGTEFLMTFHPCVIGFEGTNNQIKVYVSSDKATQVTLTIPGLDYSEVKTTIPNDVIEFSITPADGQMYLKDDKKAPEPAQVWKGRALIITSDEPIICYGVTRYTYTSDGYLAIPKSALGKRYLVSSFSDPTSDNGYQYYTSYTSIVAAYDNTVVVFRLGGSFETYVEQLNGSDLTITGTNISKQTMQKGDVFLIGALGNYGDLSGSVISSTKPVAVISGSFCGFIPRGVAACDFLIEQEMPVKTWGKKYHVSPIVKRTKSAWVKIYASEINTQLYRDGNAFGTLTEVGGIENDGGFISRRIFGDGEAPRPVTISADKPISITQYNPGQSDDGVPSDPFQMVLTPIEQYQTEITFNTPGVNNSDAIFRENYINLVYLATEEGTVPDDLEWAQLVHNKFVWKKVADLLDSSNIRFNDPNIDENGRYYYCKTIPLADPSGVYKFRANDPIGAYAYGFSDYDAYGYPATTALKDISKNDTISPRVTYTIDCMGDVEGEVIDEPELDYENRSNIRMVYFDKEHSTNYRWKDGLQPEFVGGYDEKVAWNLEVIDPTSDAEAFILFVDGSGNETMEHIKYTATDISIVKSLEYWGLVASNSPPVTKSFKLVNNRDNEIEFDSMELVLKSVWDDDKGGVIKHQGFAIDQSSIDLSGTLQPSEERTFDVTFDPAIGEGSWKDSIGVIIIIDAEECYMKFLSEVRVSVGSPRITVSDIIFPRTTVGQTANPLQVLISNPGSTALTITDYTGPTFKEVYNENITLPIIIDAGKSATYTVQFTPDAEQSYPDSIVFQSNAKPSPDTTIYDPVCYLNGEGEIPISVEEPQHNDIPGFSLSEVKPNPVGSQPAFIEYEIGADNIHTEINLYDASGNLVVKLVNGSASFGKHSIALPELSSGLYFCRMSAGKFYAVRKIVVGK